MITISIGAESIDDAVDILLKKQPDLERHPMGKLDLEIDKIIVIPVEPKTFN
jgi:hypothetical protein